MGWKVSGVRWEDSRYVWEGRFVYHLHVWDNGRKDVQWNIFVWWNAKSAGTQGEGWVWCVRSWIRGFGELLILDRILFWTELWKHIVILTWKGWIAQLHRWEYKWLAAYGKRRACWIVKMIPKYCRPHGKLPWTYVSEPIPKIWNVCSRWNNLRSPWAN